MTLAESPLVPDREAHHQADELLGCLLVLARLHGRAISADGALAGLPLEQGRLTPTLFERAAHRAGLSSRIVRLPVAPGGSRARAGHFLFRRLVRL